MKFVEPLVHFLKPHKFILSKPKGNVEEKYVQCAREGEKKKPVPLLKL